ncbi:PREDICTED: zinc finger CCCH domain-containing protein 61-like [Camelina sativa]|uniref:Zinc finger CCCH domain-containing protein 61-like n=1 Tax=Camelina sativa TaxID=90675 RepID=A0ABM0Y2F7_CAMSA|nr:PREDICTED: zinc finger CCCH domain-containing protein 61-like [Camelina sativa]
MDVGHINRPTVDILPRKLLSSAKSPSSVSSPLRDYKDQRDYSYDSDSEDPYAGDHFRMYEFKIRRCTRSRSHDWTDCPFSHPGEKARRRDPRRFHYIGEVCPEYSRQGGGDCSRGDQCGFAHGVFECWLHPSRYRTEACKDGKHCKRKVCFFAHSPRQLRILLPSSPENYISGGCGGSASSSPASVLSNKNNRCCLFCSHSPTSTLLGLSRSPSSSPPLSPADKAAAFSRLSRRRTAVLNELISSLDSFSLTEALAASSSSPVTMPVSTAAMIASANLSNHHQHRIPPWLDVGERDLQLQQGSPLQFALSPSSTPSYLHSQPSSSFFSDGLTPHGGRLSDLTAASAAAAEAKGKNSFEVGSSGDLDLGWVNDLLT